MVRGADFGNHCPSAYLDYGLKIHEIIVNKFYRPCCTEINVINNLLLSLLCDSNKQWGLYLTFSMFQSPVVIKGSNISKSAFGWNLEYLKQNLGNSKQNVWLSKTNRCDNSKDKGLIHTRHFDAQYCNKNIFLSH